MKEKVTMFLKGIIENILFEKEPDPQDYLIGFTFKIPRKHEEISCYWFESVSKCEARTIYERSIRCYEVERVDDNIWLVMAKDAYYLLRVLMPGMKPANTHFLFSPFTPLTQHNFCCAKIDFDSNNRMYTMPWYTDAVESYEIIESQYADSVVRILTRNRTVYYCLLLNDDVI